jgi:uncharacterized membrane protein
MEELLREIAHYVALAIEAAAIVLVACGAAVAFYRILVASAQSASTPAKRLIFFRFAQWLIAGLAFQLAADIVNTVVAPNWNQLGHLAAIAVIRTFLTYFLDKDMERLRESESEDLKAFHELKESRASKSPKAAT